MTHELLATELTWPAVSFSSVDEAHEHLAELCRHEENLRFAGLTADADLVEVDINELTDLICQLQFSTLIN